ncbi:MAG: tRNA pseudouridine(38-40) synthase TruA [Bacteroidetes bacterium]|nr:tRNA pseudouridine(38-40) synthase TruA [Bacteroidota bacterium]
MRYFLRIRYHGAYFHGWQIQPNALTVQQVVQEVLSEMLHAEVETVGCGRTDAGVHADDFYLHFDTDKTAEEMSDFLFRLKARKIKGIQFRELFPVKEDAHARYSATQRTYEYRIADERNPFLDGLVHFVRSFPEIESMNTAAGYLNGRQDFSCFSRSNTQVNNYLCDVREAGWAMQGSVLVFKISADRFLRNMVRAIVGTMLEIGEGKRNADWMKEVIQSQSRAEAGSSAEACGLFLTRVEYPDSIRL